MLRNRLSRSRRLVRHWWSFVNRQRNPWIKITTNGKQGQTKKAHAAVSYDQQGSISCPLFIIHFLLLFTTLNVR